MSATKFKIAILTLNGSGASIHNDPEDDGVDGITSGQITETITREVAAAAKAPCQIELFPAGGFNKSFWGRSRKHAAKDYWQAIKAWKPDGVVLSGFSKGAVGIVELVRYAIESGDWDLLRLCWLYLVDYQTWIWDGIDKKIVDLPYPGFLTRGIYIRQKYPSPAFKPGSGYRINNVPTIVLRPGEISTLIVEDAIQRLDHARPQSGEHWNFHITNSNFIDKGIAGGDYAHNLIRHSPEAKAALRIILKRMFASLMAVDTRV